MKSAKHLLFDGISEEELSILLNSLHSKVESFCQGSNIYTFGKDSNLVGIIQEGLAKIKKIDINGNEILLENLKEGGLFGDMLAFLGRNHEIITIYAETNCTILFIRYEDLIKGCSGGCNYRHKFLMNLFKIICDKTSYLSERIEIISNKTIREKLLCYFNICFAKNGEKTFPLEMSLSSLSDYLCVDRSAMMREIKKMKEENIFMLENKKVTLYV